MLNAANRRRFEEKVNKQGRLMPGMKTRCHEWIGSKLKKGYGTFFLNGRPRLAHRVAFFIKHGRWPEPQALHRCDNPSCTRLNHLREGTPKDNTADMIEKGRSRSGVSHGERNGNAKLTDLEVQRIIKLYSTSSIKQQTLAEQFGVSQNQVSSIVRGRQRNATP